MDVVEGKRRWVRPVVTVLVAMLSPLLVAESADARVWRPVRASTDPVFADLRVCRDGIEFALGTVNPSGFPSGPSTETVELFRAATGARVLDFTAQAIPVVADPRVIVPDWDQGLPSPGLEINLAGFTKRWAGGILLTPGETVTGLMGFIGIPPFPLTFPGPNDPPIAVQQCSLLGPGRVHVDVKPGVTPNRVSPSAPWYVPLAVLSDGGFHATTIDRATVTVGNAAARNVVTDADGDGDLDLLLLFKPTTAGLRCGDTRVVVTGTTIDGLSVRAFGAIVTICG